MNEPATKFQEYQSLCVDFSTSIEDEVLLAIVDECEKAQREGGSDFDVVFMTKGLALLRLRRFDEAVSAFRNAKNHAPNTFVHRPNLVGALVDSNDLDGAIREAEESLKKFDEAERDQVLMSNYAEALFLRGRPTDARKAFKTAVRFVDVKRPSKVFGAARSASAIEADHEAAHLFARYLALRIGKKLGTTDPIEFIKAAPEDQKVALADPINVTLMRSIRRVTPIVVSDDEDGSGALAVLEEWDDLRHAATEHVFSEAAE